MAEKKMPGRFTIQFNLEDPQQRTAAGLLEQQGRRKAQFLASAVLQYMQIDGAPAPVRIDMGAVKRMMLELLHNDPDFSEAVSQEDPEQSQPAEIWATPDEERTMTAISKTLAAFQKN